jgi:hypothetical protein
MRKIKIFGIILSLLISILLTGCFGEKPLQEKEVVTMADKAVAEKFPQMTGATKSVSKYTSENAEFYDVTYNKKMQAQADGKIIEIPQIVIITINIKTGEQIISISD